MNQRKRPFVPSFLNRFDDYLLKHSPEIWSARAHLVVYFGMLFMVVSAFFSFIVPDEPKSDSDVSLWVVFVSLIAIVGLVLWVIFLLRFNVFKRFGQTSALNRLKTWFLYFIAVGTIVSTTYVPSIVVSWRANMAYSDDELATDLNRMNELICTLSYDSLPHSWTNDTVIVLNSTIGRYNGNTVIGEYTEPSAVSEEAPVVDTTVSSSSENSRVYYYTPLHRLIDTSEFRIKKMSMDSLVQINDSTYYFSECPSYIFINDPGLASYSSIPILQSEDLYNLVIRNYKKPDEGPLKEEMSKLSDKYFYSRHYDYSNYYGNDYGNYYGMNGIQNRFKTSNISESLENIHERKHIFNESDLEWQIRVWFYITFVIVLLVFNFRHSTPKAFFLSLLTSVLLSVLTGLIMAFSSGDGNSLNGCYFFYLLVFTVLSFSVFQNKTRNIITGISINLFSWMIYFLPIIITAMYYEGLKEEYYRTQTNYSPPFDYDAMTHAIFLSEIIGFALFLVLIPTLLHRFYRKWYSLPEE